MKNLAKVISIFLLAALPVRVLGAEGVEKGLAGLKTTLENKQKEIDANLFTPYNIMMSNLQNVKTRLDAINTNGTVTVQDLESIRESLVKVQGVSAWFVGLRSAETSLKSKIAELWNTFGALTLTNEKGEVIGIPYYLDSKGVLINQPYNNQKLMTAKLYRDLLPLWEAIRFTNEKVAFTSNKGGAILPWMLNIFTKLAAIDFMKTFEKQFSEALSKSEVEEDKYKLVELMGQKKELEDKIAALEKTDSASINKLAYSLKSIA